MRQYGGDSRHKLSLKSCSSGFNKQNISPRVFLSLSCATDELMDIPHVIRRTIITAARGKTAVNSKKIVDQICSHTTKSSCCEMKEKLTSIFHICNRSESFFFSPEGKSWDLSNSPEELRKERQSFGVISSVKTHPDNSYNPSLVGKTLLSVIHVYSYWKLDD